MHKQKEPLRQPVTIRLCGFSYLFLMKVLYGTSPHSLQTDQKRWFAYLMQQMKINSLEANPVSTNSC